MGAEAISSDTLDEEARGLVSGGVELSVEELCDGGESLALVEAASLCKCVGDVARHVGEHNAPVGRLFPHLRG